MSPVAAQLALLTLRAADSALANPPALLMLAEQAEQPVMVLLLRLAVYKPLRCLQVWMILMDRLRVGG